MKLLATPFLHLFGIVVVSVLAAALVSADERSSNSATTTPDQLPPRSGTLSLLGLDLRIPLTRDEASFLEATLRDVFNRVHKTKGIDLVTDAVAIVHQEIAEDNSNSNTNSNLRGSDRKLRPTTDIERCFHDPWGPLKGQVIEDCCYDIEFVLDGIYCDLCDDGYYDFMDDKLWERFDDVLDQPDVYIQDDVFYQYTDDDIYWKYIATAAPTTAPPSPSPTEAPSPAPTAAPTDRDVALERGPKEPSMDPISWEILYQLHRSPFRNFHRVHRIKFGGW